MRITAVFSGAVHIVYGIYVWLVLLIVMIPVAIGLALIPGVLRRRQIARWGARSIFLLIGSRIRMSGKRVPEFETCVVVANHSSYLDGIILTAALPARFTFLVKQEMSAFPVAGFVLKRLGSEFVNREDARHRHRAARRLLDAAAEGTPLAFFPEGTFDVNPGLKPFQLGAFRAAWRADLPMLPVAIKGARHKLPSGALLLRPGPISVRITKLLAPHDYEGPQTLMHGARRSILQHLDEPDLQIDAEPEPAREDS